MNAPTNNDVAEEAFVLSFPCPFCRAPAGQPCGPDRGKPSRGPHTARRKKAGREAIRGLIVQRIEDRPGRCRGCGALWSEHEVERKNGRTTIWHQAIEVPPAAQAASKETAR